MTANERSDLKLHLHHAPIEIERKFLIANDAWTHSVVGSVNIRDGLIASYKSRKVRVRISDQIAVITIKGPRRGIARAEYEYEIPLADAELIIGSHPRRCPSALAWRTEHSAHTGRCQRFC